MSTIYYESLSISIKSCINSTVIFIFEENTEWNDLQNQATTSSYSVCLNFKCIIFYSPNFRPWWNKRKYNLVTRGSLQSPAPVFTGNHQILSKINSLFPPYNIAISAACSIWGRHNSTNLDNILRKDLLRQTLIFLLWGCTPFYI